MFFTTRYWSRGSRVKINGWDCTVVRSQKSGYVQTSDILYAKYLSVERRTGRNIRAVTRLIRRGSAAESLLISVLRRHGYRKIGNTTYFSLPGVARRFDGKLIQYHCDMVKGKLVVSAPASGFIYVP